jgi:hypothetical protein
MEKKIINPLLEVVNKKSMLINPYRFGGIPRDGLIGKWLFSGNTNDNGPNGLNAISSNNITLNTDRKSISNSCYSFLKTNRSYIRLPKINTYIINNEFSVSFWFKGSSQSAYMKIINEMTFNGGKGYAVDFGSNGQKIRFVAYPGQIRIVEYAASIFDNNWHHIVCQYKGGYMQIYIDGSVKVNTQYTGTLEFDSTSTVYHNISKTSDYDAGYLTGDLDDFIIYNRGLTADEINILYTL